MALPEVADGTAEVEIATLKSGILVRFAGEDVEHAQSLACRLDDCPPILVQRSTATVIDGAHRVLAAKLLGRETIRVRYFTGTHEEAFVEAVKANVSHGKPLTLAEREAAATKLLTMHGDWSNRLVAGVCGLSDKTIGRLRKTIAELPQSSARIGRDGRHRPVDTRLLRNEIASARCAPSPTRDPTMWRDRCAPPRRPCAMCASGSERGEDPVQAERAPRRPTPLPHSDERTPVDWSSDNAILSLPGGSGFAEWLTATKIESRHWEAHLFEIPLGRIPQLIAEAKTRAAEWTDFAASLEERFKELNRRRA